MRTQQGMTFISMVFVIALVGFTSYIALRVLPVYMRHYTVVKALEAVKEIPRDELDGSPSYAIVVIKNKLNRQFTVDDIRNIDAKDIIIKRNRHGYTVSVKYSEVENLFKDIDLVFHFHPVVEVKLRER